MEGKTERTIFHLDMDAFFASIEILLNPSLKGKPVIVGGNPDKRGVVSTCSYEAREYGVRSAMSLSEAKRRCPHAIFIEGHYSQYRDYSDRVMAILYRLTPKIEIVSIDEAYLDVTDRLSKYPSAIALAQLLKEVIYRRTQLPCSIGIAPNKMLAKIGSGMAKPNGIYEIPRGKEAEILRPLPIQTLPGIGEKTRLRFNQDQIYTIGNLQDLPLDYLLQRYGTWGYSLHLTAIGQDNRPVEWAEEYIPKSIGAETTFEKDICDRVVLKAALKELTEKSWKHLRERQMHTGSITLKLRDANFKTITRARKLFCDTNDLATLQREAFELFEQSYFGQSLRLIGISLHKLTDEYWQPAFLDCP